MKTLQWVEMQKYSNLNSPLIAELENENKKINGEINCAFSKNRDSERNIIIFMLTIFFFFFIY